MTFIGISIACWSLHLMPTVVPRQLFSLFVSLTPLHSTSTCFVLVFDKLSSLDCQRVLTRLTTVSYQHKGGTGEFNSKLCFYFQCQIYLHKLKGGWRFFLFTNVAIMICYGIVGQRCNCFGAKWTELPYLLFMASSPPTATAAAAAVIGRLT